MYNTTRTKKSGIGYKDVIFLGCAKKLTRTFRTNNKDAHVIIPGEYKIKAKPILHSGIFTRIGKIRKQICVFTLLI